VEKVKPCRKAEDISHDSRAKLLLTVIDKASRWDILEAVLECFDKPVF
jgi:hypothetical protein